MYSVLGSPSGTYSASGSGISRSALRISLGLRCMGAGMSQSVLSSDTYPTVSLLIPLPLVCFC